MSVTGFVELVDLASFVDGELAFAVGIYTGSRRLSLLLEISHLDGYPT